MPFPDLRRQRRSRRLSLRAHAGTRDHQRHAWDNHVGTTSYAETALIGWAGGTPPTATYTCIQNKSQLNGTGGISSDPNFPHSAQGDYRLDSDSPCHDTGLSAALPADVADLDGDSDTGEHIPRDLPLYARVDDAVVDMGAEYQAAIVDCNDNDIPDECDIADCDPEDPDCQDCNANGYPDSCDIAAEISLDEDENGIPDECEGEGDGLAGGTPTPPDEGEGFTGGTPMPPGGTPTLPGDPAAYFDAWIEYYEWLDEQEWGPDSELTGAEQFRLMVDKLKELGLPIQSP